MSTKRKIVVSSDSDDDMPFTQEKQKKAATPAKKRTKPVVLTDDDEEEENAPQKKTAPKRSRKQEKEESDITSDEDELVRGTDEKKKRKGGKKELPVGQKTLDYMFKPSSSSSKRDDPKKKVEKTLVNPADFFKNSPAPSASKLPKVAPKPSGPPPALSWVDKYKPKRMGELVGQNGDKSPINKLLEWIKDWAKHNLGEGAKIKKPKPAPWMSSQDGTSFKAALLSGSPGVGKTTCAYMACQQLGLQLVEMNASDVRSKKHLEAKIGELSGSHQIEQFFGAKKCAPQDNQKVHHILIMDEVDGMSGNEDNEEKTTDVVIKVRTGGGAGASKSARGGRGGGRARGGRGSKK